MPLKRWGRVIGALEVSFMGAHVFGQEDRGLLALLGQHCAQALSRVVASDAYIHSVVMIADGWSSPRADSLEPNAGTISERERQVLELLMQGLSHREIADKLGVGTATVKTYIDRLCEKLQVSCGARSRGLAAEATRLGLVPTLSQFAQRR